MRQFKWIEWNLEKIDAHGLSAEEVEAAFDAVYSIEKRNDGSFRMFAATPAGRRIGSSGVMTEKMTRFPMFLAK